MYNPDTAPGNQWFKAARKQGWVIAQVTSHTFQVKMTPADCSWLLSPSGTQAWSFDQVMGLVQTAFPQITLRAMAV